MTNKKLKNNGACGLRLGLYTSLLSGLLVLSSGAAAQTADGELAVLDTPEAQAELARLDAEVLESNSEQTAFQLAQRQIADNDLSGAATTLERYLIADSESQFIRTEYAIILCRLDDLQAGRFEVAKMKIPEMGRSAIQRVQTACRMAPSQMTSPQNR